MQSKKITNCIYAFALSGIFSSLIRQILSVGFMPPIVWAVIYLIALFQAVIFYIVLPLHRRELSVPDLEFRIVAVVLIACYAAIAALIPSF